MKKLYIISIYIFLFHQGVMISGCATRLGGKNSTSSGNTASDSSEDRKSSDDNNSEDDKSSDQRRAGGDSSTKANDESLPQKKDLYDSLQITLGSDDESVVEKTVATLLSQDQGDTKALNALALYHYSRGRESLAKMIFKTMLEKDPKNAVVHNNLGVIYSKEGEPRLAVESFRKAVSFNPNYPIAHANLGSLFAVGRDYGKARHFLEVAYKGGVKDVTVLNNYAVSLMEDGSSQAENIYKEALQIGASDSIVSFNYALYLTYIKKDFKEASTLIDKIRFMGIPPNKKQALIKMEETISGKGSDENKR